MDSKAHLLTKMEKALRLNGGTHSVGDVYLGLQSGKYQGWFTDNSGVITEILVGPQKKWLNCFLVFGDMEEAISMHPQVIAFAKEHGCSFMTMNGRWGWQKILPKYGWTNRSVSMALPLED